MNLSALQPTAKSHRRWLTAILISVPLLATACGSSAANSGNNASGSVTSWVQAYCASLNTYQTALTAEQTSFNNTNPPDAPGLKTQEASHIQKYISITQAAIAQLQSGGSPAVPDGQAYVAGYLKAFNTLHTSLQAALTQANALDVTEDSTIFTSDLQGVSTSVNGALTTFVSDWNGVDPQFTNPGDNPLVKGMNNDSNCKSFRSTGSATPSPS